MIVTYKVEVERDGKWWMINVPDIDQLTQARRLSEVDEIARSLIAISTDKPIDDIAVEVVSIRLQDAAVAELVDSTNDIRRRRREIAKLEASVQHDSRQFAYILHAEGIPVRDIAELLGITPQRVSQLLNE